ncbi:putative signal peptide-containing protein [Cryptosporidium canis]|uniref:Signal peptide-containing protein n=1 Tax=Cryptosporidium canis TaxID=195482 RepID=A0ABQ8P2K2_9CRYT|nr:putative signal peptide-containing protein [Cryptosporidium canis]
MGILGSRNFRQISVVFLFFTVILFALGIELLSGANVGEGEENVQVGGTNGEAETNVESSDEGSYSPAIGVMQSSDFDSSANNNNNNDEKKKEELNRTLATIRLMQEPPPILDLDDIPRFDRIIGARMGSVESNRAPGLTVVEQASTSNLAPAAVVKDQGSTSSSGPGSGTGTGPDSSDVATSSSVLTSTSTHGSASDQSLTSDINKSSASNIGEGQGSSEESQPIMVGGGFRGNRELQSTPSPVGADSDSSSRSSASSSSSFLLPLASQGSLSENMELELLLKSSAKLSPSLDFPLEQNDVNAVDTPSGGQSQEQLSSQAEGEAEGADSKVSKTENGGDDSEFSSDIENHGESHDNSNEAISSPDITGATSLSTNLKADVDAAETGVNSGLTPNEPDSKESSVTDEENQGKSISVATQTSPIQQSTRLIVKRVSRKVMTKRGLARLLKEISNSNPRKRATFFRKLFAGMTNDDINLISILVGREISHRGSSGGLKKVLASSIPEKPLLGKEWIQREVSRKQE